MSGESKADARIVEKKSDLTDWLAAGCKPESQWKIGTEHEKFVYRLGDFHRLPYQDPNGGPGIADILSGFTGFGWTPVKEQDRTIALKSDDGASISLEPGGQLELSGAPLRTLHQTCVEVNGHLQQARLICEKLRCGMIGLGFDPKSPRSAVPRMPKARYDIMFRYMPTRGELGLDMMLRTCTVQVNLDFSSEADMVRKMRVSLALQPLATALFANSPFREGAPSGYLSSRSHCWTDTDPDRCGVPLFVFEDGFGFERWVDYMLDVPMYFLRRDGRYLDMAGRSFRDFMNGALPGREGERPTLSDWEDHLSTAFPEVRLKRFLEMRGADAGPWRTLCALPALWVGLLYETTALSAAEELIRGWTAAEIAAVRAQVPTQGLQARIGGRTLLQIAGEVLEIARGGLNRRARLDSDGNTESHFIKPLERIVTAGETDAEKLLRLFRGEWNGDIDRIYPLCSY